ncbi:transcription initiation factor TFIID subunit 1 [Harpegnathos saltator]|uniref:transcription initiation factor TFIID subunit 1 n=1 Tax=Harpegnathos saltator TaxID=610380 RepID=UPI000DBED6BF|nr:transcription initiation factor TFIID subunit 1 [Harpegnathos saltator]
MSREFYVPCTPYAYQQCGSNSGDGGSGSTEGVVVSVGAGNGGGGGVGGMDCMPLRPGPFHYLISEQAKSLVALQELQNEVGALLEFRDLVIETFPNLRHKMAATASAGASVMSSTCTQSSHIPLPLSSPSSRRIAEWEPGKLRRRVPRENSGSGSGGGSSGGGSGGGGGGGSSSGGSGSGGGGGGGGGGESSSLPRSRSNSHSGGTKNNCSATVQDSGFSTEASSKDSASTAIAPRASSPRPNALDEAEDELWNLLDVIHRKGIRLREEVECLQGRLESVATEELASTDVLEAVRKVTGADHEDADRRTIASDSADRQQDSRDPQVIALRREKEQLLDKVAELEAETISSRARTQELQSELAALSALKTGLEDRLQAGLTENTLEILAPGVQRLQPIAPVVTSPKSANVSGIKSKGSAFASVTNSPSKAHKSRFRTRTIEKNVLLDVVGRNDEPRVDIDVEASVNERRARLGALDSILVSPTRVTHVKDVDSRKIAAILRENSPLELQRHLITTTVHNQVLQKRLDEVEKSTETLSERLDKAREENDDLRFQLEERNIELEGTRARVRVLERLQQRPPTEHEPEAESEQPRCEQSGLEPGSSTESARDHHQPVEIKPSPRRRPSRIPLPGSTSGKTTSPSTAAASGTVATTPPRPPGHGRNDSRESLKSLTRPPRDSSRDSHGGGKSLSKPRDSSRDSLGSRSLSRSSGNGSSNVGGGGSGGNNNNNNNNNNNSNSSSNNNNKETNRESSLNRSLPRNNSSRDSLNKSSSLSRARDSLESNNLGTSSPTGTAPPRRPPAPARRSHSLARAATSVDSEHGKSCTEAAPSSWYSNKTNSLRHSDSSLYPDSLNQEETSSVTGSTRVEFMIGSPTRRFRTSTAWPHRYFDSIDSAVTVPESLLTDEFPPRRGEALAECDSLECHPISSED